MIRRVVFALWCGGLWACNTAVAVDPEGGACDPGNVCPTGYSCVDGAVCHKNEGTGGGAGGGSGGGTGGGTGRCATVTCSSPPASTCSSSTVAKGYTGTCEPATGQCTYTPVETTCAGGCQGGTCVDLCTGQTCASPPAARCADANTLRTFASSGQCVAASGLCTYPSTDIACTNGCVNGGCLNQNLCTGACTTPPAPVCTGSSLRTYASLGTCDPGTGQCSYTPIDTACPGGCASGACVSQSLVFTQVGPRLRFRGLAVDQSPGTTPEVLVVGLGGHVSRWNGSTWSDVATPSGTPSLRSVAYSSSTGAFVVGSGHTAWRYGSSPSPSVSPVASFVGGSSTTNYVAVSARADNNVLIADDQGGFARLAPGGGGWAGGSLPGNSGPYAMTSAYVDDTNRERIAGACGNPKQSCVGYRNANNTTTFSAHVDSNDTGGLFAVGPSFDVPTSSSSLALIGRSTPEVGTHWSNGSFGNLTITPALEFDAVVGLTGAPPVLAKRPAIYALTTSGGASKAGHLYRLTQPPLAGVGSTILLDTFFGYEALSPTENNGVVVLESKSVGTGSGGVNNVFHKTLLVDEALELGEDWYGVSTNLLGDLVLVNYYGDVAFRRAANPAVFEFHRGPPYTVGGAEAQNGTGVLIAGVDTSGTTDVGGLERYFAGSFTPVSISTTGSLAGVSFTSVCRVSDTDGWAVGTGGAIVSLSGTSGTQVSSPTSKDLRAVACGAMGQAFACGQGGLVLTLSGGSWKALTPAFPSTSVALTSCVLSGGVLYAAGDGVFAKWTVGSAAWQSLTAKPGLAHLVVRSGAELYATATDPASVANTAILRWDGSSWTSLLSLPVTLWGGMQVGAKVVYGGSSGVLIEGR